MLNKSIFKPFMENYSFQRDEKNIAYLELKPDLRENKLILELKTLLGLKIVYKYDIENDVEVENDYQSGYLDYKHLTTVFKKLKARDKLSFVFKNNSFVIKCLNPKTEEITEINVDVIQVPEFNQTQENVNQSKIIPLITSNLKDTAYLSNFKIELEAYPQFGKTVLREHNNEFQFVATAGSSLHCCKIEKEKSEEILEGKEYLIPSAYMKNINNFDNEIINLSIITINNKHYLRLNDDYLTMEFPILLNKDAIYSTGMFLRLLSQECECYNLRFKHMDETLEGLIKSESEIRNEGNLEKFDTVIKFHELEDKKYTVSCETNADVEYTASHSSLTVEIDDENITFNDLITISALDFLKFIKYNNNETSYACKIFKDTYSKFLIFRCGNRYMYTPIV